MIEARYDLAYNIAGHDFYTWLVMAAAKGATKVVFGIGNPKETKWAKDVVLERFWSIMEPGPAMMGIPYRIGEGGVNNISSPHMMDLVRFCNSGQKIRRLKTILQPRNTKFTITIRHEPRIEAMNSNKDTWYKFGEKIGAVVFEDYNDVQISIQEKLSYYAGATMNFGVINGPMHLITLTEYPVTIFKANTSAPNLAKHGIPFGTQLPWATPNQRLIWEDDNYDILMRNFETEFKSNLNLI